MPRDMKEVRSAKKAAKSAPAKTASHKKDRHFVTALSRGLDIMRCFNAQRSRLGTSEIAQITGLPQPTVWRLCHTLVSLGYLVPTRENDKLRVGAPVLSLGYAALAELDYAQIARPHMQELAEHFRGAVALAERDRLSMLYIERCQANAVFLMNLPVGSRIPIYNSAVGWAYLAGLPFDEREQLLEQSQRAAGDTWRTHKANIDQALIGYAEHGFVINCGIQHPDINAAAVPVRSADGRTLLSLNCGAANSVISKTMLIKEVGPALQKLARVLQAQPVKGRQ
jgi:DNA-binding IclR family transcriptional regulator